MRAGKEALEHPTDLRIKRNISFTPGEYKRIEEAAKFNLTTPMSWIYETILKELSILEIPYYDTPDE